MANLIDHDLSQIDAGVAAAAARGGVRRLHGRLLEDLKAARNRLNQGPGNSSRRPRKDGAVDTRWGQVRAADGAGLRRGGWAYVQ